MAFGPIDNGCMLMGMKSKRRQGVYRPRIGTIKRVCDEIRKGWDDVTHRMRAPHLKPRRYEFPAIEGSELVSILEESDDFEGASWDGP